MAYLVAGALTTAAEVKDIIDTDLTDPQICAFINSAHAILGSLSLGSQGLGTDLIAQIECWLSAHLVAIRDQRESSTALGPDSTSYQTAPLGQGLAATAYGQQALALDFSGTLAALGKQRAWLMVS